MQIRNWSQIFLLAVFLIQSCFAYAQNAYAPNNSIQPQTITYKGDLFKQLNSNSSVNPNTSVEFQKAEISDLKKYSPEKINSMMTEMLSEIKASKPLNTTLKKFPQESLMFFFILGSFTATQLFVEFEKNPMGGIDFLTHQLSPVGMFSFMTFIYMNNVTHTALNVAMKNSDLKFLIPHLSMSAGFIAQSVSSQLLSSPNFKGCTQSALRQKVTSEGAEKDPCSVLYDKEVIKGKLLENAPALISMLSSAVISGVGEKLVYQGIYKVTGINLYLNLSKKVLQIGRMSVSVMAPIQMAAFTAIQTLFVDDLVMDYWQRGVSASLFHEQNKELVDSISKNKQTQWSDSKYIDSLKLLLGKKLSPDFKAYRTQSLRKVLESNASWSRFLENVLKSFSQSYNFYLNISEELLRDKIDGTSKLDLTYPLYGIPAPALKEGNERTFISKPIYAEKLQFFYINSSEEKFKIIKASLANDHQVYTDEKNELFQIIELLINSKIGLEKEESIKIALQKFHQLKQKSQTSSSRKNYYILALSSVLGNYSPQLLAGQGYTRSLIDFSDDRSVTVDNLPTSVGKFKISHPSEYYLLQMICGPKDNEASKLLTYSVGFAARFVPPRLIESNISVDICDGSGELPSRFIFTTPVVDSNGKKYPGIIDFLRKNIAQSKLGADSFNKWWLSTVHGAMKSIFSNFSNQYNLVAIDLHNILFNRDNKTNLGPINEAVMGSLLQESKLYSFLLGEVLKDIYKIQTKTDLFTNKKFIFSSQIESKINLEKEKNTDPLLFPNHNPNDFNNFQTVPLLSILNFNSNYEWNGMIAQFPLTQESTLNQQIVGHPLQFQVELEYQVKKLIWMIQKIQITKTCEFGISEGSLRICKTTASGTITPNDVKKELDAIQKILSQIETLYGLKSSSHVEPLVIVSPELKTLLEQIIGSLNGTITEIGTYGNQFSAVNWDTLQAAKDFE